MNKEEFKDFVATMIDIYGIRSYLNSIEEDMTQEEIDDDLWFECPECGDPILYEDFDISEYIDKDMCIFTCPICEEEFDF